MGNCTKSNGIKPRDDLGYKKKGQKKRISKKRKEEIRRITKTLERVAAKKGCTKEDELAEMAGSPMVTAENGDTLTPTQRAIRKDPAYSKLPHDREGARNYLRGLRGLQTA